MVGSVWGWPKPGWSFSLGFWCGHPNPNGSFRHLQTPAVEFDACFKPPSSRHVTLFEHGEFPSAIFLTGRYISYIYVLFIIYMYIYILYIYIYISHEIYFQIQIASVLIRLSSHDIPMIVTTIPDLDSHSSWRWPTRIASIRASTIWASTQSLGTSWKHKMCLAMWVFPNMWVYPTSWLVYNGKNYYQWMMTGGTPISGNHHVVSLVNVDSYNWNMAIELVDLPMKNGDVP